MNDLEIYPNYWGKLDDEIEYLNYHFERLKKFYSMAATNEQAVICYLL